VQFVHLLLERGEEQLHQELHFVRRTPPVLAAEGEKREVLDALVHTRLHGRAHGLEAALVTGHAREETLLRPASVAVHDDRDVARDVALVGYCLSGARMHV
jgi:hypothetical protein